VHYLKNKVLDIVDARCKHGANFYSLLLMS